MTRSAHSHGMSLARDREVALLTPEKSIVTRARLRTIKLYVRKRRSSMSTIVLLTCSQAAQAQQLLQVASECFCVQLSPIPWMHCRAPVGHVYLCAGLYCNSAKVYQTTESIGTFIKQQKKILLSQAVLYF